MTTFEAETPQNLHFNRKKHKTKLVVYVGGTKFFTSENKLSLVIKKKSTIQMFSDKHSIWYFLEKTKIVAQKMIQTGTGVLFLECFTNKSTNYFRHLTGATNETNRNQKTLNSQSLANGRVSAYLHTFVVSIVLQSHRNTSSRQKINSLMGSSTWLFFLKLKQIKKKKWQLLWIPEATLTL